MTDNGVSHERSKMSSALPAFIRPPKRVAGIPTSTGVEVALVPATFAGLGWLADRALGTSPLLIIVLTVVGVSGMLVKAWLGYDSQMKREEEGKVWSTRPSARIPDVERPPRRRAEEAS